MDGAQSQRSEWLVIDTMTPETGLVFSGGRPRSGASLDRRDQYRSKSVTAALRAMVREVCQSRCGMSADLTPSVTAHAHPVVGPPTDPDVYAVALWMGPANTSPPRPRTIGTMVYEPGMRTMGHSVVTERDILDAEEIQTERIPHEVFSRFQRYPNEDKLGPWASHAMLGKYSAEHPDALFQDEIELEQQVSRELIRVHLSMRPVEVEGSWVIRGLIHDISDVRPPSGREGYDLRTARTVVDFLYSDFPWGIGRLDFATGVLTEWFKEPPGPLARWSRENAIWDPVDLNEVELLTAAMASGEREEVGFESRVRFPSEADDTWYPVRIVIRASTPGGAGNGLFRVVPLT